MDSTIDFYNKNSEKFIESTVDVDMSNIYVEFEKYILIGGKILDLGCGSGRDTKYFLTKGYKVTAIDGSENICSAASEYLKINVHTMNIECLNITDTFDGIWACASLLHIKKVDMKRVIDDLLRLLNPKGVLYASWKYGDGERTENEKYYSAKSAVECCISELTLSRCRANKSKYRLPLGKSTTMFSFALVKPV